MTTPRHYLTPPTVPDPRFTVAFEVKGTECSAAWYAYHGTEVVEDAWLCETAGSLYGGTWTIHKHHPSGNGHCWVTLTRSPTP